MDPKKEFDYLLEVRGLKVHFPVKAGIIFDHVVGWVKALDGIDLTIKPGQVVGLVGESGSGKTTLAKVLLLLEKPTQGEVLFRGKGIHSLDDSELKAYRRTLQAVFQDPFASLSPRLRVQEIITEPLRGVQQPEQERAGKQSGGSPARGGTGHGTAESLST